MLSLHHMGCAWKLSFGSNAENAEAQRTQRDLRFNP